MSSGCAHHAPAVLTTPLTWEHEYNTSHHADDELTFSAHHLSRYDRRR